MSLGSLIFMSLRWAISIGVKFFRVVPGYTIAVVLFTLISQITTLLAFFLPLKVIILLGSSRIPRYFPDSWQSLNHDHLVVSLTVASACFYLLTLISEKILVTIADRGAQRLLERSRKIILFSNQDKLTKNAYLKYSSGLAGLVFSILAFTFMGILYPYLALVIFSYIFMAFTGFWIGYRVSEKWQSMTLKNLRDVISVLSSVGFLIAFAFMVLDFLSGATTSMIIAIISLLLVRQLMSRLSGLIISLAVLYSQRIKINALLFHGHQLYLPAISAEEHEFWSLFNVSRRDKWVSEVLYNIVGMKAHKLDYEWRDTSISDVIMLKIIAYDSEKKESGEFLVKVFNSNKRSLALHEENLLATTKTGSLPALPLLGITHAGEYRCHLFRWPAEKETPANTRKAGKNRTETARHIFSYEPDKKIVARYLRSKLLLWQRLDTSIIDRLDLITSNRDTQRLLDELRDSFEEIVKIIRMLPLYVVNPDINPETMITTVDGKAYLLHWGRWSIEPIGADWSAKENDLNNMASDFDRSREHRKSLLNVSINDVRLAALIFEFEKMYNRQLYLKACNLLPRILECLKGKNTLVSKVGI